jgi:Fe2+ or Zn2+ uptake regulation protein
VKSVDVLTEQFRARGLKVTPQRQSIFRALSTSTVHPTAEAVYAAVSAEMPTISLRTVYQTLNDLAAMGELSTLDVGTGSTRFDPNLEPHHHLVCDGCGRIEDLHIQLPGLTPPTAGDAGGFQVTATEIVFRGRCAACAPSAGPSIPPNQPNTGDLHG